MPSSSSASSSGFQSIASRSSSPPSVSWSAMIGEIGGGRVGEHGLHAAEPDVEDVLRAAGGEQAQLLAGGGGADRGVVGQVRAVLAVARRSPRSPRVRCPPPAARPRRCRRGRPRHRPGRGARWRRPAAPRGSRRRRRPGRPARPSGRASRPGPAGGRSARRGPAPLRSAAAPAAGWGGLRTSGAQLLGRTTGSLRRPSVDGIPRNSDASPPRPLPVTRRSLTTPVRAQEIDADRRA